MFLSGQYKITFLSIFFLLKTWPDPSKEKQIGDSKKLQIKINPPKGLAGLLFAILSWFTLRVRKMMMVSINKKCLLKREKTLATAFMTEIPAAQISATTD